MLAWMLYVIMVTLLLSLGAIRRRTRGAAQSRRHALDLDHRHRRLAGAAHAIASVAVELPNVVGPQVAREDGRAAPGDRAGLSPAMWIRPPRKRPRWRRLRALLRNLWLAASAAMLLALIASGVHLALRKRRWQPATVAGAPVLRHGGRGTRGGWPAAAAHRRAALGDAGAAHSHQSAVIAHEQSHLEARDPQLFTLALALLVFMPWNLPLWWQLRRLRYAIEIDCDARVLKGGMDPAHYGETLISVGERQSAYIGAVAAMSESKSFLEERMRT